MSNVEPQNVEGWFRFAQSFLKWTVRHKGSRQAEFIYSTFDVGRSMFISFFFDLTGRPQPQGGAEPVDVSNMVQ
jgi:hypothetical protein